jgi:hypothetical protein
MNCVLRPSPPYYLNPGILPPGYVTIDNSGMQSYEQNVITTPGKIINNCHACLNIAPLVEC